MKDSKPTVDIKDRKIEFQKIIEKNHALSNGLTALGLDYSYYINSYFTGDKKIYSYRDNLNYRINAAIFHIRLLLQKHDEIDKIAPKLFSDLRNTREFHHYIFQSEMEINALFDSIIFHISSIFDYLSLLILYVCLPKTPEEKMWSQLLKSMRDLKNPMSKKIAATIIKQVDDELVKKFNDYRADLIHKKGDTFKSIFSIEIASGKTKSLIFASEKLLKPFKKHFDGDSSYTITYFTFLIFNEVMDSIAKIISELKKELENSEKKETKKGIGFRIIYVDPVSKKEDSPSIAFWPSFLNYFKL